MLFGNESISTFTRANAIIWVVLAFQAGLLNMGGFMASQHFVSHVTGYATLIGFEVGQKDYVHALDFLSVPLFFLLGSMISGFLVDLRLQMKKKPRYHVVFGVLFLLILAVVVLGFNNYFGPFGQALYDSRDYTLVALLCLICGIQNGTVSLVSRSVVRTTHLTGITTDLGIGLVRILNKEKLKNLTPEEGKANLMRIGIILGFILGSLSGMKVFTSWGYRGFLLPTAISAGLFGITLYFQVIREWRLR